MKKRIRSFACLYCEGKHRSSRCPNVERPNTALVVWAAAYEDTVRHGHWMRSSFASAHPTQLCDVNHMLACPPLWAKKPNQPAEKCPDCLRVLAEALALALARLGKTCGELSPCGRMLCRKPPHEGDEVHLGNDPHDPEASLWWLDSDGERA